MIDELLHCYDRLNRMREAGVIKMKPVITRQQIIQMFDQQAGKYMASETFMLKEIKIQGITINGRRHLKRSVSWGPVIIDMHEGHPFAVDGKHRILDAIDAGKDTIEAYVGDKTMYYNE